MMAQGRSDDSEGCNTDPQAWQGEIDSSIAHRVGFSMGNSKLPESEVGWRCFLFLLHLFLIVVSCECVALVGSMALVEFVSCVNPYQFL